MPKILLIAELKSSLPDGSLFVEVVGNNPAQLTTKTDKKLIRFYIPSKFVEEVVRSNAVPVSTPSEILAGEEITDIEGPEMLEPMTDEEFKKSQEEDEE